MNSVKDCQRGTMLKRSNSYPAISSHNPALMGIEECNKIIPKDIIVQNTFNYMYFKFGSGIFVEIKNNKLHKYYPFYNTEFKNEFSELIKTDMSYFKTVKTRGKPLSKDKWRANNCLIKVIQDSDLGESFITELKVMLEETLAKYKIKDICFFVNRKDFPIWHKDGMEPYHHIYGENYPLISHKYSEYAPIYGLTNRLDYFKDRMLPTYDCWQLITQKYYPPTCSNNYTFDKTVIPWNKKKQIAVFRGSATGCYIDIEKNPRLLISKINQEWNKQGSKYKGWIDAGVTRDINKDKKNMYSDKLQRVNIKSLGIEAVSSISMEEQKHYKYIFDIEGNSAAFRLGALLSFGSVILKVESEYKMWIDKFLKPKVHYIPIKRDFSNLAVILKWCHTHDDACQKLGANARKAYERYFNKPFVYKYLSKILNENSE